MKLKKLLKYYDKYSYIKVFDSLTGITTEQMTATEFIKMYGKDILKRKVMYIDVSDTMYTIIITI